ncbi:hypothetical protein AWM60_01610 [Micrococcus aloeverae]|nr:hypothetical protein AWM60_01610 [Micrococcus aloeverae]
MSVSCAEARPSPRPYTTRGTATSQPEVSGPRSRASATTPATSRPSPISTVPGAPNRAAR